MKNFELPPPMKNFELPPQEPRDIPSEAPEINYGTDHAESMYMDNPDDMPGEFSDQTQQDLKELDLPDDTPPLEASEAAATSELPSDPHDIKGLQRVGPGLHALDVGEGSAFDPEPYLGRDALRSLDNPPAYDSSVGSVDQARWRPEREDKPEA